MGGRLGNKTPRGAIGERIFAEVEQLTADGKMKRLAAFNEIAKRTGGQVGTVSANYYRIARKRGVQLRPGRGSGRGTTVSKGTFGAAASAIHKLESLLRAKEQEIATLRKENGRFKKLRRLLNA